MSIESLKRDLADIILINEDSDSYYEFSQDLVELVRQKIAELEETKRVAENALANVTAVATATTICAAGYDPRFPDECTDRCK